MSERGRNMPTHLPVYEAPEDARRQTWLLLVRAFTLIERRVASALAAGHEVTLPQFDVLATLQFNEGVTQQELAARLLVSKGNVCGVLDRLERLGWVERRPDLKDARANRLHLTPAGRRKVRAVVPAHDAVVLRAMRGLSAGEVRSLRELLAALERSASEAA